MRYVFSFNPHIAYTVDACALTSILLSLSCIDVMYYTADRKATPASVQGVGVDFEFYVDFASPQCLKRVHNKIARFRFVFSNTDGYGV
jgi:hypothetical protein